VRTTSELQSSAITSETAAPAGEKHQQGSGSGEPYSFLLSYLWPVTPADEHGEIMKMEFARTSSLRLVLRRITTDPSGLVSILKFSIIDA